MISEAGHGTTSLCIAVAADHLPQEASAVLGDQAPWEAARSRVFPLCQEQGLPAQMWPHPAQASAPRPLEAPEAATPGRLAPRLLESRHW